MSSCRGTAGETPTSAATTGGRGAKSRGSGEHEEREHDGRERGEASQQLVRARGDGRLRDAVCRKRDELLPPREYRSREALSKAVLGPRHEAADPLRRKEQ